MYTIIVCEDGSLYGSCKKKIMQREKLFNKLCFLVPQYYNGYDMSKCTVTMRYLLPISKEFRTETLTLSEERYKDCLRYILPLDTDLTKEHGDIRLNLTFTMLDFDDYGNIVQRVRKTTNHILTVNYLPDWDSVVPDASLAAIDQRILKQDAQIKKLENLAEIIDGTKVDNLVYNSDEDSLQLSSNGLPVGDKISVRDMLDDGVPVVNFNSSSVGADKDNNCDCDCDCSCEDNVVEFGYNGTTQTPLEDDSNVVEF